MRKLGAVETWVTGHHHFAYEALEEMHGFLMSLEHEYATIVSLGVLAEDAEYYITVSFEPTEGR